VVKADRRIAFILKKRVFMAGFWKRQFDSPASPRQQQFDVLVGIVLPILCLLVDPGIFRSFAGGSWFLKHLRLFAYMEITAGILALLYYMLTRRASSFLTGVLSGSAFFALALGFAMLPVTLIGMLFVVGIFGLAPFFTSFVFARSAARSWRQCDARDSRGPRTLPIALGFVMVLAVPAILQSASFHYGDRAVVALQSGSDQDFAHAVRTLKLVHYDTDQLAFTYQKTNDANRRARLARAFTAITGEVVQDRLSSLND
jgi:hypothetical protein